MDEFIANIDRELPPHADPWVLLAECEQWLNAELPTWGSGKYECRVLVQHEGGQSQRPTREEAHAEAQRRVWNVHDVTLFFNETWDAARHLGRGGYICVRRSGRNGSWGILLRIAGPVEREVRGLESIAEQVLDRSITSQTVPSDRIAARQVDAGSQPAPDKIPVHPADEKRLARLLKTVSNNPLLSTVVGGALLTGLGWVGAKLFG